MKSIQLQVSGGEWRDISSLLTAAGRFELNAAQLAELSGVAKLAEGQQSIGVRFEDRTGIVSAPQLLNFKLDTIAPELNITGLPDNVAWEDTEQLAGNIVDLGGGVEIEYQFNRGTSTKLSASNGQFAQSLASHLQGLGANQAHTLTVNAIDGANNQGTRTFNFMRYQAKADAEFDIYSVDDAELVQFTNESGIVNGTVFYQDVYGWFINGGSYGGGGGSRGSSGGWWSTPRLDPTEPWSGGPTRGWGLSDQLPLGLGDDPTSPPPSYLEKVGIILKQARNVGSLEPAKRGSLQNRMALLLEIGRRVEAENLYHQMGAVMYGIFKQANSPIVTRSQAWQEGTVLAQDLKSDTDTVRVEVLQTSLMYSIAKVLKDKGISLGESQQLAMKDALERISRVYASEVSQSSYLPNNPFDWLDMMWKSQYYSSQSELAQVSQGLDWGIYNLKQLLQGISNPAAAVGAMQFVGDLMESAMRVSALHESFAVEYSDFWSNLIAFGFHTFRLNPTVTTSAADMEDWIGRLWQGQTLRDKSIALGSVLTATQFRRHPSNHTKIEFSRQLLEVAQQLPFSQNGNSQFFSHLTRLGLVYKTDYLYPNPPSFLQFPTADVTRGRLTDGRSANLQAAETTRDATLQKAAQDLSDWLQVVSTDEERAKLLRLSWRSLSALQWLNTQPGINYLWTLPIQQILSLSRAYAALKPDSQTISESEFLGQIWQAPVWDKTVRSKGGEAFATFLSMPKAADFAESRTLFYQTQPIFRDRLNYGQRLLQALKQIQDTPDSALRSSAQDMQFIDQLLLLGGAYAGLEPKAIDPATNPKLFLEILWRDQNIQKGATELETYLAQFRGSDSALLKGNRNLLGVLKSIPSAYVQEEIRDVGVMRNWLNDYAFYANLKLDLATGETIFNPGNFHDAIWAASTPEEQRTLGKQINRFVVPDEILVASNTNSPILIAQSDVWEGVRGGLGQLIGAVVGGIFYAVTDAGGKIIRIVFRADDGIDNRTEGEKKTDTAIGKLLEGATPIDRQGNPIKPGGSEKGGLENFAKPGGKEQQQKDIEQLATGTGGTIDTQEGPNGEVQTLRLPDGGSAGAYPKAHSTGEPSIQVNLGKKDSPRRKFKIRYRDNRQATIIIPTSGN
jgi:hypothetical protein